MRLLRIRAVAKVLYQKVDEAMDLLRSHGLPFGVSICYTSVNSDSVTSEEYIDWLIDKGALFACDLHLYAGRQGFSDRSHAYA